MRRCTIVQIHESWRLTYTAILYAGHNQTSLSKALKCSPKTINAWFTLEPQKSPYALRFYERLNDFLYAEQIFVSGKGFSVGGLPSNEPLIITPAHLKAIRSYYSLTLRELAARIKIGWITLARFESGCKVSSRTLAILALYFLKSNITLSNNGVTFHENA